MSGDDFRNSMRAGLTGENEEDIAAELADLMDKAGEFYDEEMKGLE